MLFKGVKGAFFSFLDERSQLFVGQAFRWNLKIFFRFCFLRFHNDFFTKLPNFIANTPDFEEVFFTSLVALSGKAEKVICLNHILSLSRRITYLGMPFVILYQGLDGRSGAFTSDLLIQSQPVKVHSLKPGETFNGVVKSPSLSYFFFDCG